MQDKALGHKTCEKPVLRLARAIHEALSPLFMRFGINYPELKHILGWSMANTALRVPEFAIKGRKVHRQTLSHAAIITGMTRREVSALAALPLPDTREISGRTQRITRVLTTWRTLEGYQDSNGRPLALPVRGPFPSFETLAKHSSRDTPTRAMADMLVSNGNARWEGRRLRLVSAVRTPPICSDEEIYLLTRVTQDFLGTVNAILNPATVNRPHIRTSCYQDISVSRVAALRDRLHEEMAKSNARYNAIMEEYRAAPGEAGVRIGVNSFSFAETDTISSADETNLRIVKD